ncbi:MAG: class I SAM-dependent methyltransferase [Candidatus Omnitrophota bacterium]|jgi:ubiquinone/menaquinone biosynthesis C-methylase UbiE|nr:MAG: class I SAM-dependent methyltransferase [Candidatus Omnitrophota bacterium]
MVDNNKVKIWFAKSIAGFNSIIKYTYIFFSEIIYCLSRKLFPRARHRPSARMINLVTGCTKFTWFVESGKLAKFSIEEALSRNKIDYLNFNNMLDFGCGCGRVISHFYNHVGAKIYGVDINKYLIDWCKVNFDSAEFDFVKLSSRLPYPDNKFDFIYALSVFTHLPENSQLFYFAELWRILRKEQYLLVSLHGDKYIHMLNSSQAREFNDRGIAVINSKKPGSNLCIAIHSQSYLRDRLSEYFQVVDVVRAGAKGNPEQDLYLLKKNIINI